MQQYGDRLSRSSSCRKSSDEMRKVVRDNLQRPSLLSTSFSDEKSSSSRSFRYSVSNGLSSRSYRERGQEEAAKMKAPNLIARLMGLDIVPSENIETFSKEEKSKLNSDSPTSMFQFEEANSRNLQSSKSMLKMKRTTLRSLMEKDQLEVLANCHRDIECEALSSSSNSTPSSSDSLPSLSYDKILQMNKETLSMVSFRDVHLSCSVINEVPEIIPPIPKKNEWDSVKLVPEDDNSDELRKMHRQRARGFPNKFELPQHTKKTPSAQRREQKKDPVKPLKRDNDGRKRGPEKQEPKISSYNFFNSRSSKEVKLVPTAIPEKRLATVKSSSMTKAGETLKRNVAPKIRPASTISTAQTENITPVQSVKRSTSTRAVKQKESEAMSHPSKANNISRNTKNSSGNYKQVKQLRVSDKESIKKDKKMVCEIMPKTKKERSSGNKGEAATKLAGKEVTSTMTRRIIGAPDLKKLLLNNPSFLAQARQLCHQSAQPLQDEKGIKEDEKDAKLYLACAKEFIERKTDNRKLCSYPLLQTSSCFSGYKDIDHLVLEITENIDAISSYSKNDDDREKATSMDSLYIRLEKDLRCLNDMNAMWSSSWSSGVFTEEMDGVVGQIEEHVLTMLTDEIVVELLNWQFHRESSL